MSLNITLILKASLYLTIWIMADEPKIPKMVYMMTHCAGYLSFFLHIHSLLFSTLCCACEVTCLHWLLCLLVLGLANGKNRQDIREKEENRLAYPFSPQASILWGTVGCVPWLKILAPIKRPSPHSSFSFCSLSKCSLLCTIPRNFLPSCPHLCNWPPYKTPLQWLSLSVHAGPLTDTTCNTTLDLYNTWQNNMHSCQQKSNEAASRHYYDHVIEVETGSAWK